MRTPRKNLACYFLILAVILNYLTFLFRQRPYFVLNRLFGMSLSHHAYLIQSLVRKLSIESYLTYLIKRFVSTRLILIYIIEVPIFKYFTYESSSLVFYLVESIFAFIVLNLYMSQLKPYKVLFFCYIDELCLQDFFKKGMFLF